MSTIKGTFTIKDSNELKEIYPRTSADMVTYGNTTVDAALGGKADVADLSNLETSINTAIADAITSTYGLSSVSGLIDRTIKTISNDEVTSIGTNAFANCDSLTTALFPNATYIGGSAFNSCSALTTVDFSNVATIDGNGLYGCSSLINVCFPKLTRIETRAFDNCSGILCLIILSPEVATLVSSDAFNNSGITTGSGYVYVPDDLVESYKSANNWSDYSGKIKGLSELPSEYDSLLLTTGSADLDFILGGES